MSSNYLFTYTKTDIAFITLKLCKLHKRDASYLCIFADVIYMNMRIEIWSNNLCNCSICDVIYMSMRIRNLRKRIKKNGRSFGERDRLIMHKMKGRIMKLEANKEYLEKLDESFEQAKNGEIISFSLEELREMEFDNWTPTKKVLDFL